MKLNESYNLYKTQGDFPVVFESSLKCNDTFNDTIYAINASEIKDFLKSYSKSMIYLWSPNCSSEACWSFGAVQEYADSNGYELFIVMEKYSHQKLSVQIRPERPLYSINHRAYSNRMKFDKYQKVFSEELTGDANIFSRYLFFDKGVFKSHLRSIEVN